MHDRRRGRTVHGMILLLATTVLVGCAGSPGPMMTSTTASVTAAAPTPAGRSDGGQSALDAELIEAVWRDDVDRVELLIGRGADVNAIDDTSRNTALIRAAERGHADTVGILLQTDVAVDHVNNLGRTGLHAALESAPQAGGEHHGSVQDYIDTARLLVASGADTGLPARSDGRTPLDIARSAGLSPQVRLLEEAERAVSPAQGELGGAAGRGDADAAAVALRHGAGLEERNRRQQTPLLVAAAADHLDVARLLVRAGADPNAVDDRDDTPWLVTGVTGSVQMGQLLLDAGADLTLTNRFGGLSPIPASERGHADYVEWVVSTDVDLDHVNTPGWTALLEAVVYGDGGARYQRIVRMLLDAGVDSGIADAEGRTALDHAANRGQTVIARILQDER